MMKYLLLLCLCHWALGLTIAPNPASDAGTTFFGCPRNTTGDAILSVTASVSDCRQELDVTIGYFPSSSGSYTATDGVSIAALYYDGAAFTTSYIFLVDLPAASLTLNAASSVSFTYTPPSPLVTGGGQFIRAMIIDRSSSGDTFDAGVECADDSSGADTDHHFDNLDSEAFELIGPIDPNPTMDAGTTFFSCAREPSDDVLLGVTVAATSVTSNSVDVTISFTASSSGSYSSTSGVSIAALYYDSISFTSDYIYLADLVPGVDFTLDTPESVTFPYSFPVPLVIGSGQFIRAMIIDRASSTDTFDSGVQCANSISGGASGHHFDNLDSEAFKVIGPIAPDPAMDAGTTFFSCAREPTDDVLLGVTVAGTSVTSVDVTISFNASSSGTYSATSGVSIAALYYDSISFTSDYIYLVDLVPGVDFTLDTADSVTFPYSFPVPLVIGSGQFIRAMIIDRESSTDTFDSGVQCANSTSGGDTGHHFDNLDVALTVLTIDVTPPTVVTQDVEVTLDAAGSASIVSADIDGGSSDACGVSLLSASQTSFSCADVGANTVTLTVTDVNGNVAQSTATVTVIDDIAPVLTIPSDASVVCDSGGGGSASATDICGATVSFVDSFVPASCTGSSTVTRTWTAADPSGNSVNDAQTLTMQNPGSVAVSTVVSGCGSLIVNDGTVVCTRRHLEVYFALSDGLCECDLQASDLDVINAKILDIRPAVSVARAISTAFVVSLEIPCGGAFKVLLSSTTIVEGVLFDAQCLLSQRST